MKTTLLSTTLLFCALSADLMAQSCRDSITATTPDRDFEVLDDGTAVHLPTGWVWMRCSLGQEWTGSTCTGTASVYTWTEALDVAEGETFAGHGDWKLPTNDQLLTLVEKRCTVPSINRTVFPNTASGSYWTATPFANDSGYSWGIAFDFGTVNFGYYDNDRFHIRLVSQHTRPR